MPNSQVSLSEIEDKQYAWAQAVIHIGALWQQRGDFHQAAVQLVDAHYAYGFECGTVQFKPTRARQQPFRQTARSAVSYFVGGDEQFPEDAGFALMPWRRIVFNNQNYYYHYDIATVMGTYEFYDHQDACTIVEYTFGYVRTGKQQLKLFLHHSSLPYRIV